MFVNYLDRVEQQSYISSFPVLHVTYIPHVSSTLTPTSTLALPLRNDFPSNQQPIIKYNTNTFHTIIRLLSYQMIDISDNYIQCARLVDVIYRQFMDYVHECLYARDGRDSQSKVTGKSIRKWGENNNGFGKDWVEQDDCYVRGKVKKIDNYSMMSVNITNKNNNSNNNSKHSLAYLTHNLLKSMLSSA